MFTNVVTIILPSVPRDVIFFKNEHQEQRKDTIEVDSAIGVIRTRTDGKRGIDTASQRFQQAI